MTKTRQLRDARPGPARRPLLPGQLRRMKANAEAGRRERAALDEGKAQLRYWSPDQVLQVLVDAEKVIADLRGLRPSGGGAS